MTKRSHFNFDKDLFGFNLTEHGVKSYSKSFKIGPFQQTININLGNGHVHGTTSVPGTGLSKRYTVSDKNCLVNIFVSPMRLRIIYFSAHVKTCNFAFPLLVLISTVRCTFCLFWRHLETHSSALGIKFIGKWLRLWVLFLRGF